MTTNVLDNDPFAKRAQATAVPRSASEDAPPLMDSELSRDVALPPPLRGDAESPPSPGEHRSSGQPGRPRGWVVVLSAALVAAVVAAAVTLGITHLDGSASPDPAVVDAAPVSSSGGTDATSGELTNVSDVAAAVSPAVAYVEVGSRFGSSGSGSAVILSSDGAVVTNAHVVDGARSITVTLADGSSYDAELVGADATSDIAVLDIDATDLPVAEFDPSVEVGETVVAIGSPFGLEGSVTSGIVSAIDRTISGEGGTLVGLIQTDAAINPGNSGGALVDGDGDVVGIATAIYSTSGSSSGVGFAVPASTVAIVAEQLLNGEQVVYPQLGVSGSDVTPEAAAAYGLDVESGVVVMDVAAGTGAANAGIRRGDVITMMDDEVVTSMTDLAAIVPEHQPGDAVSVTLVRDGGTMTVDARLGETSS